MSTPDRAARRRMDGVASDDTARSSSSLRSGEAIGSARRLLELGRRCDRSGRMDEAIGAYEAAVQTAEATPSDGPILAEALRRLAVMLNRRGEGETARSMCQRSYQVAATAGNVALRAEALNTLGGLELTRQSLDDARRYFDQAIELSANLPELRGRIEQNLGILYNMRDDRATALEHYHRSLQAFRAAANDQGCAIAYHNLGMISADQKEWEAADQFFELGRRTAQEVGDDHLRGLCLMNRVEVLIALKRFDAAQLAAETALSIFEELHAPAGIADVQRMLGIVLRETGRLGQAQSRLELAIELARETGSPVSHGEALREAALLHCKRGHLDEAVDCLLQACLQFSRVPVVLQGPEVVRGDYPNLVRDWCELVRAVDPEAADHSDRVAAIAVRMAQALGLPAADQAAIRLAGQLHCVGMLRPAHLTVLEGRPDQSVRGLCPADPGRGADLLAAAGCFDHVAPIVRYLSAKGNGPADAGLADPIAPGGQVVSLADAFDRLVHRCGSQSPMPREGALARLAADADGWPAKIRDCLVSVTTEAAG